MTFRAKHMAHHHPQPRLEDTLRGTIETYAGYLNNNEIHVPTMHGNDDNIPPLISRMGSTVAERYQERFDADVTRTQTAYLLKRFHKNKNTFEAYQPGTDATMRGLRWAVAASFSILFIGSYGLALGAIVGSGVAYRTYQQRRQKERDKEWLEDVTARDIQRTANLIRSKGGGGPPGYLATPDDPVPSGSSAKVFNTDQPLQI